MARLILLIVLLALVWPSDFTPIQAEGNISLAIVKETTTSPDGTETVKYKLEVSAGGKITRIGRHVEEIGASTDTNRHTKFFHFIDLNNNGFWDRAEWEKESAKQDEFSAILENYDADGDGMISLEEFYDVQLDPSVKVFIEYTLGAEDELAKWNDEIGWGEAVKQR